MDDFTSVQIISWMNEVTVILIQCNCWCIYFLLHRLHNLTFHWGIAQFSYQLKRMLLSNTELLKKQTKQNKSLSGALKICGRSNFVWRNSIMIQPNWHEHYVSRHTTYHNLSSMVPLSVSWCHGRYMLACPGMIPSCPFPLLGMKGSKVQAADETCPCPDLYFPNKGKQAPDFT